MIVLDEISLRLAGRLLIDHASVAIPEGARVGVVGRNGSGKTTLMKILSRVTAPTEGRAIVRGRVGALLQVGTGFHPELSGRDNIGLSGAILGMSQQEIQRYHEAIVEFSEIGDFLDTPVKHYSSGMFSRLAFSVSAHLPSEVLLVDEALSVGDAAFREKSKRRIREVVTAGRTVLFVSHTAETVVELCDSAIVLDAGRLMFWGDTVEAITVYERDILKLPPARRTDFDDPKLGLRNRRRPSPPEAVGPVAAATPGAPVASETPAAPGGSVTPARTG
jgi:ABC-type polysaccharide/polyol phosphate transport system ATPase subunit